MAEDNVVVEQVDRDAAADILDEIASLIQDDGIGQVADLIRDGEYDEHDTVARVAHHRLATQAHEPSADVVEVRKVETVTGDFMQDEGEPFWRIEIGGYCADFNHEQAARNFAAAIAAMRPESERAGIAAWLRNPLTYVRGLSMAQSEHLADAIERGDHIKEPSHD